VNSGLVSKIELVRTPTFVPVVKQFLLPVTVSVFKLRPQGRFYEVFFDGSN
jgi:hypothetical protein